MDEKVNFDLHNLIQIHFLHYWLPAYNPSFNSRLHWSKMPGRNTDLYYLYSSNQPTHFYEIYNDTILNKHIELTLSPMPQSIFIHLTTHLPCISRKEKLLPPFFPHANLLVLPMKIKPCHSSPSTDSART